MGRSCLLTALVSGCNRVPAPPARMMPFMVQILFEAEIQSKAESRNIIKRTRKSELSTFNLERSTLNIQINKSRNWESRKQKSDQKDDILKSKGASISE